MSASTYGIYAYAAATLRVPVTFVSGDETLCREVAATSPPTHTFVTPWGEGASQQSLHPNASVAGRRDGVIDTIRDRDSIAALSLPKAFVVEIQHKEHSHAYYRSFHPGAERIAPHTVRFAADDYFEALHARVFLI